MASPLSSLFFIAKTAIAHFKCGRGNIIMEALFKLMTVVIFGILLFDVVLDTVLDRYFKKLRQYESKQDI